MADTLDSALAGLIPVAFGFALGFLSRPVEQWLMNRTVRRRLVAAFSSEVGSIWAMAERSITINTPSVAEARKGLNQDTKSLGGLEIDDVDYPMKVYDSHLTQIDLFGTDLVVLLTELYRWIGYAHHWKRVNLRFGEDLDRMMRALVARGEFSTTEKEMLTYKAGATIHYAEQYLKIQAQVLELAKQVADELRKISKPQIVGKVSVTTGAVVRETFPKR